MENPRTDKQKEKNGIVGFGLLVKSIAKPNLADDYEVYSYVESLLYTEFQRILSIDEKTNEIETTLFIPDEPIFIEKIDGNKYFQSNLTNDLNIERPGVYFAYQTSDSSKEIVLTRFKSILPQNYGYIQGYLTPSKSYKTLQIKVKPGEITFLGNFMIEVTQANSGKYLNVNFLPANQFLLKSKDENLQNLFFGNEERSELGMELNFLNKFVELQHSGHWKEMAVAKIKKISSKR
ncbi:hypothetical protein NUH30_19050 [Leptospira sp. 85282-16]|uniref:hypothetical protein n=1 Tax=Leptospira TaxID=171 RepID=UPI0010847E58|nr:MULTISPECIES: hypothetical protein [Leptospira]MCT8335792.1 hypothetical protein [Leptospira sp. 85282-16]TGK83003.1 hypothetical protein EHQ19_08255 [Leptospira montravelensis]